MGHLPDSIAYQRSLESAMTAIIIHKPTAADIAHLECCIQDMEEYCERYPPAKDAYQEFIFMGRQMLNMLEDHR